jgi:hypothetical protein
MKYISELLPELGEIIVEDFRNPRIEWVDVFVSYAFLFDAIYEVLSLPDEAQYRAAEAIEEFIVLRQKGEWDTPDGVAFKIRDIVHRYKKLRELMTQLPQKMLEDFADPHSSLSAFYDTLYYYSRIIGHITEVFSHQDKEVISKSLTALEEFLQNKKRLWEVKAELETLASKYDEDHEEGSHEKQKT